MMTRRRVNWGQPIRAIVPSMSSGKKDHSSPEILRFGVFEVDLRAGELRERGRRVKLQDKPFQTLALLLKRHGEIVTREELQEGLWPSDTFVEFDANLNAAIRRVREALGDSAERPRYVETLPKRGYRFLMPVEKGSGADTRASELVSDAAQPRWNIHLAWSAIAVVALVLAVASVALWFREHPQATQTQNRLMLAVLPFQNLSGRPDEEFVSDGMTEEMTTQLGRLDPEHLGVIARTSVMRYKNSTEDVRKIGQELRVDFVLESSVRRDADQLYVTAQLIRVNDQTHLWAETYVRPMGEIFAIQRDVARRIAQSLALKLLPGQDAVLARAETTSTPAYEDYLRGRYQWGLGTDSGFRAAVTAFEEAISKDPNYAIAYAGIARCYLSLADYHFMDPSQALDSARQAVARGMVADSSVPELYLLRAVTLDHAQPKPPGIEEDYRRALVLDANDAEARLDYALYLRAQKRSPEAVEEARRGLELDPASPLANVEAGWVMLSAGREADASDLFEKALGLSAEYPAALYFLARVSEQHKRSGEAIAYLERAVVSSGRTPKYIHALGMVYAESGKNEEARRLLEELREQARLRYVDPEYRASLAAKVAGNTPR